MIRQPFLHTSLCIPFGWVNNRVAPGFPQAFSILAKRFTTVERTLSSSLSSQLSCCFASAKTRVQACARSLRACFVSPFADSKNCGKGAVGAGGNAAGIICVSSLCVGEKSAALIGDGRQGGESHFGGGRSGRNELIGMFFQVGTFVGQS